MSESAIRFIDQHRPVLTSGSYEIKITQKLKHVDKGIELLSAPAGKKFFVPGKRFKLDPSDIEAVFPLENSLGDYSNVLPHVVLKKSTLPWEQKAISNNENVPWLALLLFGEGEQPVAQTTMKDLSLSDLIEKKEEVEGGERVVTWPGIKPRPKETGSTTIIDVPAALLNSIIPTSEELQYLSHVRQALDSKDKVEKEVAVVICNRLPKEGTNTVHLVSLEERISADKQKFGKNVLIRLISLKSWKFICKPQKKQENNFNSILKRLDAGVDCNYSLRLPQIKKDGHAEPYLERGFVPLIRCTRDGKKTTSWYHSPLSVSCNDIAPANGLPVQSSDALLKFRTEIGMDDLSYAAAWELGRLMALKDKHFSIGLKKWKRQYDNYVAARDSHNPDLPYNKQAINTPPPELPESLTEWLTQLSLLKNLPFNYLVPDERMLPKESIRFFKVDSFWVACLIDGAVSVGRMLPAGFKKDKGRHEDYFSTISDRTITGFILRSELVAGWPGLIADGFATDPSPCKKLRHDYLSKNVLFSLFEGEIQRVDIYPRPEILHFALDSTEAGYSKKKCDTEETLKLSDQHWRDKEKRVLNIANMKKDMGCGDVAKFAFRMLERVSKFQFNRSNAK